MCGSHCSFPLKQEVLLLKKYQNDSKTSLIDRNYILHKSPDAKIPVNKWCNKFQSGQILLKHLSREPDSTFIKVPTPLGSLVHINAVSAIIVTF